MNANQPVKIIYDTDLGGDCDDAATLAMLHRLCDMGEAELLAVTHCFASPYYAGAIDAVNHFYGRIVPVGINYSRRVDHRGSHAGALCDMFPHRYPAEVYDTDRAAPDTLFLLRKTLSEAEDGSIVLVVTGALNSMARLVSSGPDEISPLTGKELISSKIQRTVVMGGRFFETWPMTIYPDGNTAGNPVTWEWNVKDAGCEVAQTAIHNWPGELVFSSYEIGSYITTLVDYPTRAPKGSPVALAYEINTHGRGRCSWDQTAMLEAVRPGRYWHYHQFGRITVDQDCITHWQKDDACRHTYLMPKADYEDIRQIIDDLIDGK